MEEEDEPSEVEEEEDKHFTRMKLNVSSAINLDIFNMSV